MDISISRLQQLVSVAKAGSISKAAEELNISQPALSRSIAALEDYYGFEIFNRVGHGVKLTSAGMQVIELSTPILQHMKALDRNFRLFGTGKIGALSVGMAPLLASQTLGALAGDFFSSARQASLQTVIRPGPALIEGLNNDEIELLVYPEGYIEATDNLEIQVAGTIEPVCVVRGTHPLAGQQGLQQKDLKSFPWASSVVPEALNEITLSNQFICDNYHIMREALLSSDMIAICSKSFVAKQLTDGSLCQLDVEGLSIPITTVYIAKLKSQTNSPLAEEFVAKLEKILRGTPSSTAPLHLD